MLQVTNLTCGYGNMVVIEDVSIRVDEGEVVVILGPNGAGKTTLLRAIAGLLRPLRGRIIFNNVDITNLDVPRRVRLGIRYFPDRDSAFRSLSVLDNLRFMSSGKFELEYFGLIRNKLREKAGNLSGGEFKMLTLAMAYHSGARLVMLDEPSSGLSPWIKPLIIDIILKMRGRFSLLIAEQDAEVALKVADRVYIMESGHVKAEYKRGEVEFVGLRDIVEPR